MEKHLKYRDYFQKIHKFGWLIVEYHALLDRQIEDRIVLNIEFFLGTHRRIDYYTLFFQKFWKSREGQKLVWN